MMDDESYLMDDNDEKIEGLDRKQRNDHGEDGL